MFLIRGCILQVNGICHFKVLYVHTFISRVLQLMAKTQLMGQPQYPAFAPNFYYHLFLTEFDHRRHRLVFVSCARGRVT